MNAFSYDLALLAKSQPAGRMANVRKLMRIAAEFERNEGRDLRTFLSRRPNPPARRARGPRPGPGGGPRRRPDHDCARRQGPRVPRGRRARARARAQRRPPEPRHLDRPGRRRGRAVPVRPRLAFPTEKSFGVWELEELNLEEKEAERRGVVPPRLRGHDPGEGPAASSPASTRTRTASPPSRNRRTTC